MSPVCMCNIPHRCWRWGLVRWGFGTLCVELAAGSLGERGICCSQSLPGLLEKLEPLDPAGYWKYQSTGFDPQLESHNPADSPVQSSPLPIGLPLLAEGSGNLEVVSRASRLHLSIWDQYRHPRAPMSSRNARVPEAHATCVGLQRLARARGMRCGRFQTPRCPSSNQVTPSQPRAASAISQLWIVGAWASLY
jgi:hypothetical protein